METFFNELNQCIAVLDENFKFKFCNNKFLQEAEIDEYDVDNILLNTAVKEELEKYFEKNNKYKGIIKSYIYDKYIKLHSTVIKTSIENKVLYYLIVDKMGKTNTTVYKGRLNDNIDNVINKEQYYINILEEIKSNLEFLDTNNYVLKAINPKELLDGLINELYKIELVQTSFSLFLNLSTDFVGSLDKDGNFVMLEGTWTKTIGWEYEELVNKSVLNIIHNDYIEDFREILSKKPEEIEFIENKVKCKDGSYKWVKWNMRYLKGIGITVITAKDITLEKKEQERIIELEKEIESENLKNQFFANLSHEFKTPLNIILGLVQLFERNIDNKKVYSDEGIDIDNHINLIRQNTYRLLRLSNNLIDMSKIDAGYYKLNFTNNNIVNLVDDIISSVAQYAKDKGITLIFDTDCEELIVACDPDKIERILLNLLSNSIKNTHVGGNIFVNLTTQNENISISVKDNGNGIPNDKLSKIFDRFEQVDKCLNRSYEGSGIGLSLVHSLVSMHNGSIYVNSKLGIGSEFKFTIPKKIVSNNINECNYIISENRLERCNIEFSDIYI